MVRAGIDAEVYGPGAENFSLACETSPLASIEIDGSIDQSLADTANAMTDGSMIDGSMDRWIGGR
jgi:hypothetical protein